MKSFSIRKINVEEYHKMAKFDILKDDEKVELINGQIYSLPKPFTKEHGAYRRRLNSFLMKMYCEKTITIGIQDTFHFDGYSEPLADIILYKYSENYYAENYPQPTDVILLIEIADKTLQHDKTTKLQLYASANIPEYWIVNLIDNCIEVFQSPKGNFYQKHFIMTEDDVLELPFGKSLIVSEILK